MKLIRRALLFVVMAAAFACVGVWTLLLRTICSSPNVANAATESTISYNCHGLIVFITPFQDFLLHWLNPFVCVLLVLCYFVHKWQPS